MKKSIYLMTLLAVCPLFAIAVEETGESAEPKKIHDNAEMLDFWIGEWELTWKGKEEEAHGTNTITRDLNDAVIVESFDGRPGMEFLGKSFSVLDSNTGRWKQTWVDSSRGYLDFEGYQLGDKVIFHREGKAPNGDAVLQRMVFYDIKKDSFTWDWEISKDDGKAWQLRWRIEYVRKGTDTE